METEEKLKELIHDLAKSEEFDEVIMKRIKNICKTNDAFLHRAYELILTQIKRKHCIIRINCLSMIDQLFQRSHVFRSLMVTDLQTLVQLCLGTDPTLPLPLPASQQKRLVSKGIKCIKEWDIKYGEGYKQLRIAVTCLKEEVDFDEMCLVSDPDRLRRRERQERINRLAKERVDKVRKEMDDNQDSLNDCFVQTANLLKLLGKGEETSLDEEVQGQTNLISRRLLPKVKCWIETLTKAGNFTDHSLRKSIDMKNKLEDILKKLGDFGGKLEQVTDGALEGGNDTVARKPKCEEVDPTTFEATLAKANPDNCDWNTSDALVDESEAGPSSREGGVPRVRLEDLQEPTRMVVDPEKSRFWVSDHREGEIVNVGTTTRVTEFVGEQEPISWSCRAPLGSGKLCPRKDRRKCPLHGLIVARDDNGEIVGGEKKELIDFDNAKKPKAKRKGLKSAKEWDETSRSRIEKKISNRSAIKRVARDLNKYDKIRTKNKFLDQFNY